MNRFITICIYLSLTAFLVSVLAWIFSPTAPTVSLSGKEWRCVESAPDGLTAQCTMYTRNIKSNTNKF